MLRLSKYVTLIGLFLLFSNVATAQQNRQFRPAISNGLTAPPPVSNTAPESSPFDKPIYVAQREAQTGGGFGLTEPINTAAPLDVDPPTGDEQAEAENVEVDLTILLNGEPIVTTSASEDKPAETLEKNTDEGLKKAKGTLIKAWEGDQNAQISLAKDYLLPIFVILAVMWLASWIGNYARRMVTHVVSNNVDLTLGRFAGNATKFAILAIAMMGVLGFYGVETTSIAAAVAALGFAVGMALQGTLGNFAAGIALLIFRPFNVGDYIVVDGEEGTVRAIELFTTTIDTLDNRHVIIPNDNVFGNKMQNWSHNAERRVDVLVGVAYSADMKQTRRVLSDALQTIEGRILEKEPQIYLAELNASSVDWSCRVWCKPEAYLGVKERVTEAVKDALDQHNIEIPFPQLDLHVIAAAAQQKMAA